MKPKLDALQQLRDVVSPRVLLDALQVSKALTEAGVRHALIGGLAIGLHGHPRATKDVDFLVGEEAFESEFPLLVYREDLRSLVRWGSVDLLSVPPKRPILRDFLHLPHEGELPLLPVEALVLMKLDAARPQDKADVQSLLRLGFKPEEIASFLRQKAPELLPLFLELVAELSLE